MAEHKDQFVQNGIQIVAIGIGRPHHTALTCGHLAPDVLCLGFPTPKAHRKYGVGTLTLKGVLSAEFFDAVVRAQSAGYEQTRSTGNVTTQPAVFVVDRQGIIRHAHYGQHAGDNPSLDQMLVIARGL